MLDDCLTSVPIVSPVQNCIGRPRWSVMIPTHNCAKYLRETINSVLSQDRGPDQMQIEVVDDCSTVDDPKAVVHERGQGRVLFHRQEANVGATRNFNTCISRSLGDFVHILHGDDLVEPGFYAEVESLASRFPEAAMLATRSFYIDEAGHPFGSSPYVARYATCIRDASPLYYANPLRTPSVVIRRSFYERHGGFCERLVHVADWEMWTRAAAKGGVVMSNSIGANYREFNGNETSRLRRSGDNIREFLHLGEVFSRIYPDFCLDRFLLGVRSTAADQLRRFRRIGDVKGVAENARLCADIGRLCPSFRWRLKELAKSMFLSSVLARNIKGRFCSINCRQANIRAPGRDILG